jgi:hypothetical protein
VDNASNLMVQNSSRFNSSNTKNYVIVAGNFVGTQDMRPQIRIPGVAHCYHRSGFELRLEQ